MDRYLFLVSIQPLRATFDPLDQWNELSKQIVEIFSSNTTLDDTNTQKIIVLPEYALGNKLRLNNININYDKIFDKISTFAEQNNVIIIPGSAAYLENGQWKNRCFIWNSNGKLVGIYDKQRLFNYELKLNLTPGKESKFFTVERGLNIQILICSDLWYPELIRPNLISNNKIDLLCVPAMSVVENDSLIGYGRYLWHNLAITRARENVIPLIVSDWSDQRWGSSEHASYTCGGSTIIDPSIRWKNNEEYLHSFKYFYNGQSGILT